MRFHHDCCVPAWSAYRIGPKPRGRSVGEITFLSSLGCCSASSCSAVSLLMSTISVRVAIVGGGISGIYAAHLLAKQGITDVALIEASPELGGRILSTASSRSQDKGDGLEFGVDLGGAWHWPKRQTKLAETLRANGLRTFPERTDGHLLIEQSSHRPPTKWTPGDDATEFYRVEGGMTAVLNALRKDIPDNSIYLQHSLTSVHQQTNGQLQMQCQGPSGSAVIFQAAHLLVALPPRMATSSITYEPALPPSLSQTWSATSTWMAPHAKYVAIYDEAFWRANGLLGQALSTVGPLGEIHDGSDNAGKHAALWGFFAWGATQRSTRSEDQLKAACRAQMVRLFGEKAARPVAEYVKDWATDKLITTEADLAGSLDHAPPPPVTGEEGPWARRIWGIGSEWSPLSPGYLEGAFNAAEVGVERVLQELKK